MRCGRVNNEIRKMETEATAAPGQNEKLCRDFHRRAADSHRVHVFDWVCARFASTANEYTTQTRPTTQLNAWCMCTYALYKLRTQSQQA